jgi:ABC-2 type transport system permease protein
MGMRGFVRLVVAQATMLRRNVGFWLTSILIAVVSMLVFGWLFNPAAPNEFTLGIVDEDQTEASAEFLSSFSDVDNVHIQTGERDFELGALKEGDRSAVIIAPEGFAKALADGAATVEAHMDASDDPLTVTYVERTIDAAVLGFNEAAGLSSGGVTLAEESVDTQNASYIDFLTPGMMGMMIMNLNLGVAFLFVTWREQGILRRLGVTPLGPGSLILSQALSFALISVIQASIILAIGHFLFDVSINGSLLWLAVTVALGIACMLSLGYTLGSLINGAASTNATVNAIAFPMLFLGGSYFPLEAQGLLLPVVNAIPLTHLNNALRETVNGSGDLSELWTEWAILGAWIVAGFLTCVRLFRWQ